MSYQQALDHYNEKAYEAAAAIIDPLVQEKPTNANARLLRGHIYSSLQQYDVALAEYESIQSISSDPTVLEYAQMGIDTCKAYLGDTPHYSNGSGDYGADGEVTAVSFGAASLEQDSSALGDDLDFGSWQPEAGEGADLAENFGDFPDTFDPSDPAATNGQWPSEDSFEGLNFDEGDGLQTEDLGSNSFGAGSGAESFDSDSFGADLGTENLDADGFGSLNFEEGFDANGFGNDSFDNDSFGNDSFGDEDFGSGASLDGLSLDPDALDQGGSEPDFGASLGADAAAASNPFAAEGADFGSLDAAGDNPFAIDSLGSEGLDDLGAMDFGQDGGLGGGSALGAVDQADYDDPFLIADAPEIAEAGGLFEDGTPAQEDDTFPDPDAAEATIALNNLALEDSGAAFPDTNGSNPGHGFGGDDFESTDFEADDFGADDFGQDDFGHDDFEPTSFGSQGSSQPSFSLETESNDLFPETPATAAFGAGEDFGDDTFAEVDHSDLDSRNFGDSEPQTLFMGGDDNDDDFGTTAPELESDFSPPDFNRFSDSGFDDGFDDAGASYGFGDDDSGDFGHDEPSGSFYGEDSHDFDQSATRGRSSGAADAGFSDNFNDFGDFGSFDDFAMGGDLADFGQDSSGPLSGGGPASQSEVVDFNDSLDSSLGGGSIWGDDNIPSFTQTDSDLVEPVVSVEQGTFAFLENSNFKTKRTIVAFCTGVVAALASATIYVSSVSTVPDRTESGEEMPQEFKSLVARHLQSTAAFMALAGFCSGALTNFVLGEILLRQSRKSLDDLQQQMQRVSQGDFSAQATIHSEDELGQLAASFNHMSRVILTTTKEAQRKAEEQEQQREDLQRQVIRLLDDVEGAARGDLTVQAEVTADVLGAVADSFNLTIQNLREIVNQVKKAAIQVNKSSSDNETFARSLSSDALRQAEELAVTLNSVQVMTDSIQRVAESAREAEEVARTASATALRGGEAVEQTVAGILRIRETVAETTRKVKRLAESSQEISKIVALIAALASRTNLLALNASIEAARAGEAGRGFAIVADEVRQLADRAAKASKEIEQIVLQIQSETGSVMQAMEEGTQQVIEGTKLAEQAKRSLEDIIQVSNRIDQLVRSITADTAEQTETSRAVAQVMQSVELTAQETSQEAQRVSRSLQNLVGIARDLQTSVERFRVETTAE
ncbi:MAG: methyl-accepting chemotaxis protein [Prochlorothrix sp.]